MGVELETTLKSTQMYGAIGASAADPRWDRPMVTDLRRIGMLATVAAEAGARFARDRVGMSAAAWMHVQRRMFDGRTALEVCHDPHYFRRGVLLHRLGLGLDADPDDLDDILEIADRERMDDVGEVSREGVALYCASMVTHDDEGSRLAFHAAVASSEAWFKDTLRLRYGPRMGDAAVVREGFDGSEPIAVALLSGAVEAMLRMVDADPASPLARGLEVSAEQRFAD